MNIEFIPLDLTRDHEWLKMVLPIPFTDRTNGILAMDTDVNRPVAVAVFDTWTHTSVCVHWWIGKRMVLRHGFFEEIARYAFDVCGKQMIVGIIPSDSLLSTRLALKVGMVEVGRIVDGYKMGVDQVIYQGKLGDAGRWINLDSKEEAA